MRRLIKIMCLNFFALWVAACSGSATPQLIASFPGGSPGSNSAALPNRAIPTPGPCSAFVEVEVTNLEAAVARASDLAAGYGGFVTSLQSWSEDRYKLTGLSIVVPQPGFISLRARFLELGSPLDNSLLGNPGYNSLAYCQISLTLAQKTTSLPFIGWNPIHTFKHALSLSASIFGFVVDALIWIVVVLGPFVLVGLGVRRLLQRRSKPLP
jgi:hypothetical protein